MLTSFTFLIKRWRCSITTGLCALFFLSCNVLKRVNDSETLLTKNTIYVDSVKNNNEYLYKLLYQKPNEKILGMPVRLHIYNSARPNIDSILQKKYNNPEHPKEGLKNLLSVKQYNSYVLSKQKLNSWLKRTGEAPVTIKQSEAERSSKLLQQYYYTKGWFNNKINYSIQENNQKGSITYFVNRGEPFIYGQVKTAIASPIIDSLYHLIKANSFIKPGEQYDKINILKERSRITSELKNKGVYHFEEQYVTFEFDTLDLDHKVNADILIKNRSVKTMDTIYNIPFKTYTINEVNVFADYDFKKPNRVLTDSVQFNTINFYSSDKLRYKTKTLSDAIFIKKNSLYRDSDRIDTYKYLAQLNTFKYPNIIYEETENDTTLTANIYLSPRKRFDYNIGLDVTQSNIQTIGLSFNTGLKARNVFKGAETLEFSLIGSIGASKDASNTKDQFFDITEFGGDIKLTIPRLFFPFNTERIIPKRMTPTSRISLSATSQLNIGLDKRTLNSILNYQWRPQSRISNSYDFLNAQFVKNLNIDNYFGVYQNSYDELNDIARSIDYIEDDDTLGYPEGADTFIDDVLTGNTSLTPSDPDYKEVNNINERKDRLTENNIIVSSSFSSVIRKENNFSNNLTLFRYKIELAGNVLAAASNFLNAPKNDNGNYEVFDIAFSQFAKTELDFVKYWDLGYGNTLAWRSYLGIAVPYGNSNSIPFAKSFFSGGPNDNRAWSAYNLGPGRTKSLDEFNEANFKLHFSLEHRFNLFGDLNGAVFVDAGNIWNVFDNVTDPRAVFSGLDSLKDIAVGSGFGLRYDFGFFVFRGDIGFKTYEPYYDLNDRWFKNYNFGNAVYNIGINYPF